MNSSGAVTGAPTPTRSAILKCKTLGIFQDLQRIQGALQPISKVDDAMLHPPLSTRVAHSLGDSLDQLLTKFWKVEDVPTPISSESDSVCEHNFVQTTKREECGKYVEYIDLGHMTEVSPASNSATYYLPHHAVLKPESTTTKWRYFRFFFNGHIEKMYRLIWVDPKHTPLQRILFRNPDGDIRDYELKTVTFGVNCAPFLAIRVLQQLADDEESKYPQASQTIRHFMNVDDVLAGADSKTEAQAAIMELKGALESAGFPLRKWTSNNKAILADIPIDHRLHADFLDIDAKSTAKTLGKAYGAAIYLRVDVGSTVIVTLLTAKTRVTPVKTVSLPRLELCGALLLSEMATAVLRKMPGAASALYCWTDSTIFFAWLQKPACQWTTFVANRVTKITQFIDVQKWAHVRSEQNPADLASLGVALQDVADNQ
ncbi:uncharacterized protein [Drosophila bipectinata]|uniref:uncharacterized protein n=1 Tax=Drosophila bipectinata TaxID=42026 RepID=UPI0038B28F0D